MADPLSIHIRIIDESSTVNNGSANTYGKNQFGVTSNNKTHRTIKNQKHTGDDLLDNTSLKIYLLNILLQINLYTKRKF